jgi:hypothetical protein
MIDTSIYSWATKVILLLGLIAFVALKGVMPALSAITSDFPEYFTSAKIVREGHDPVKLYDGAWFREQTRQYGVGPPQNPGSFSPYPPPTALLLVPLASLKPLTALRIVTALNVVCLACAILLLNKVFAWQLVDCALYILLSGAALLSGLRFGHPYIAISTLCLLGYYLYQRGMPLLAGLCLGVLLPIKYYPAAVLAGFALRKQWRVLLGGVIAAGALVCLSIAALGWQVHRFFIVNVLLDHLSGHLTADSSPSFSAQLQSFDTLFTRLFVLDAVRNPHPWLEAPMARSIAVIAVKGSLLLAAAAALIKLARIGAASALGPTIGILGILALLIAPGSGSYAAVLLWLPIALLIEYFLRENARAHAYLLVCVYALMGFIPYGHFRPFEGDGGLSFLAYPRLFLLLAMFAVCIDAVLRSRPLPRSHA